MKIIELEKRIQNLQDRIIKSEIIPKCREIAKKLVVGGLTSDEWANARYHFKDDPLDVYYEVYGMGDEELKVDSSEEGLVFEAKQRVVSPFSNRFNPVIEFDGRYFEILVYNCGKWEHQVQTLYHKMITGVPEETLRDMQIRFGIAVQ